MKRTKNNEINKWKEKNIGQLNKEKKWKEEGFMK